MKKLLVCVAVITALTACDSEMAQNDTQQASSSPIQSAQTASAASAKTLTAEAFLKDKAEVPYKINDKGIVQFNNPQDMLIELGDYAGQGQLKFNSPNDFRISEYLPATATADEIRAAGNKALIYAVYKTFTYTDATSVTVESAPIDMETLKPLSPKPIKATVNRERALAVLKQHSSAQSFDDLVELNPNHPARIIGFSSSDLYEQFAYDLSHQDNIVRGLTAPNK